MKIVLVEDSPLIAARMMDSIKQQPKLQLVGEAAGEDAAVAVILETEPDAVILDLSLRPGSGLHVINRIRAAGSPAKVLVLSNFCHDLVRDICFKAGASHFFDKSTQSQDCIQMLVDMARVTSIDA